MTIHSEHPFADPPEGRDAARRFRGHLAAPVTLWCADAAGERVGLTVSSLMVALGEPARLIGLVDPDSDLADALTLGSVATVAVLGADQRRLAEGFGRIAPAPGGPFTIAPFTATPWGPRPTPSGTWAGVRVEHLRDVGWSVEVTAICEHIEVGTEEPLAHVRGSFGRFAR